MGIELGYDVYLRGQFLNRVGPNDAFESLPKGVGFSSVTTELQTRKEDRTIIEARVNDIIPAIHPHSIETK